MWFLFLEMFQDGIISNKVTRFLSMPLVETNLF